jgi:hypothetical protein
MNDEHDIRKGRYPTSSLKMRVKKNIVNSEAKSSKYGSSPIPRHPYLLVMVLSTCTPQGLPHGEGCPGRCCT